MSRDDVRLLSFRASLERDDGGGRRVRAFQRALEDFGVNADEMGVGPSALSGAVSKNDSSVRRLKRKLLPVPLRYPITRELRDLDGSPNIISLCPGTHRWAITNSTRNWVDYPDLWSNYALNASRGDGGALSRVTCVAQAMVWKRRERLELQQSSVATVASWSDKVRLGGGAEWLPTPTHSSVTIPSRRARSGKLAVGMIANFYYPPNKRAFEDLVTNWLPRLGHLTGTIVVAGFGSESLPKHPSIEIIGEVDGVSDFYDRIDFALSPIQLGGGMKVKVVEAMAYGVPVVVSDHSLDGLPPAIQQGCIPFEQFCSSASFRRIDPRANPAVADELKQFTIESFKSRVADLWHSRMALPGGV